MCHMLPIEIVRNKLQSGLLLTLLVLQNVGCKQSDELTVLSGRVLVKGTVLLDGQPLDTGMVTLVPADSSATTDQDKWIMGNIKDGKFQVQAGPNSYVVRIQKYEYQKRGDAKPLLNEKYDKKTTLKATVPEQKSTELLFELKSNPET